MDYGMAGTHTDCAQHYQVWSRFLTGIARRLPQNEKRQAIGLALVAFK
jgi:hypothetical protein